MADNLPQCDFGLGPGAEDSIRRAMFNAMFHAYCAGIRATGCEVDRAKAYDAFNDWMPQWNAGRTIDYFQPDDRIVVSDAIRYRQALQMIASDCVWGELEDHVARSLQRYAKDALEGTSADQQVMSDMLREKGGQDAKTEEG